MAENISATLRNNIKIYFKRLLYQSSLYFLNLWFSNFADHTTSSVKNICTHTHLFTEYTCYYQLIYSILIKINFIFR